MQKVYSRINWENEPNTTTPINEDNLNKMDYALDKIDDRVVQLAGYEERAKESEINAKTSEDNAKESELKAKEYAEQAQESAENVGDLIVPKGDITFEQLSTVNAQTGYMYKITNDFYTDDTFADGSGQFYLGGTKVYLNKNGLWELLTSTSGGGGGASSNDIAIPLLVDDWVANDEGTYSQRVYVAGLSADANVLIVPSPVGSTFTEEELNAYNCLTGNVLIEVGYMTFTAKEIPSMSFTVVAQGTSATGDAVATVTSLVAKVDGLVTKNTELENEIDTLNDNLANFEEQISLLNSDLEWKELLKSGTSVALPTGWKELHVVAWVSQYSALTFHILPSDIITSPTYIGVSKVPTSEKLTCNIMLETNKISLADYSVNDNVSQNAKMRVYYR